MRLKSGKTDRHDGLLSLRIFFDGGIFLQQEKTQGASTDRPNYCAFACKFRFEAH